jgi:hypothetical protein
MRYYVQGSDGKIYGPVEVAELEQWVREGRVLRDTRLRNAETGAEVEAYAVPQLHLVFSSLTVPSSPPTYPSTYACARCGFPIPPRSAVCARCGAAVGQAGGGRLATSSVTGDYILGICIAVASPCAFGIGALGALIAVVALWRRYPSLARGMAWGLIVPIALLTVCYISLQGWAPH